MGQLEGYHEHVDIKAKVVMIRKNFAVLSGTLKAKQNFIENITSISNIESIGIFV